jgi:hypothetical protein
MLLLASLGHTQHSQSIVIGVGEKVFSAGSEDVFSGVTIVPLPPIENMPWD